jgi:hypothetical protein
MPPFLSGRVMRTASTTCLCVPDRRRGRRKSVALWSGSPEVLASW